MSLRMRISIALVAIAMVFTGACLYETTALTMTAFFSLGLPLYGLGALLFVWEVVVDLRSHQVL